MKVAACTLESMSPIGFSRYHNTPKLEKERPDDWEKRTWKERAHWTEDGNAFIPPMAFKKSLENVAGFLNEKIKGQRNATYKKHFTAGVLVTEALILPVKKEKIDGIWLFVPSDGKPGGGSRVAKCFPLVQEWSGIVTYYILDELITEDVFTRHLKEAGNFIGLLFFRPQRGGFYGRYKVKSVKWNNG